MHNAVLHAKHRLRGVLYYVEGFGSYAGLLEQFGTRELRDSLEFQRSQNAALDAAYARAEPQVVAQHRGNGLSAPCE